MSGVPGFWQGRQDLNRTFMALQQHFCHSGHGTQAAVDLERGMQRPEVWHGALTNKTLINFMRLFALAEPGAAVHAVGKGPTGGFIAAQIQCFARRLSPVFVGINQRAGIERAEVGDVAVFGVADITVVFFFAVFFNLTAGTDQNGVELGELLAYCFQKAVLFA